MSTGCQKDRKPCRQTEDIQTERLTKVVQNVNNMSERYKDRRIDRQTERQMMTILRKWYYNDDNVENGEEEYEDVNCE